MPYHVSLRWMLAGLAGTAAVLGLGALVWLLWWPTDFDAALPDEPGLPDLAVASVAYTADGEELARYYRTNRTWVPLGRIAPVVTEALIATEDHRFYAHNGVDWVRLAGSAWHTLRGDPQGASTITMQLVRNLYPALKQVPVLDRKRLELRTAWRIEEAHDKAAILAWYLNTVTFGQNAFGIEAAAQTYFGVPAASLDAAQAATLVALLKGTTRYNPRRHPERARQRRDVVLAQMAKHGALTPAEAVRWQATPLVLYDPPAAARAERLAPHFAATLRTELEAWAEANGHDLYADGLRIYTTLDADLQRQAEAAVAEQTAGLQAVAAVEWSRAVPRELSETTAPYERLLAAGREPFAYFWQRRPGVLRGVIRGTDAYRRAVAAGAAPDDAEARLLQDAAFVDSVRSAYARLEAGLVALDPHTGDVRAWVGGRDFSVDQYDKVGLARRQAGSTFKPFVYAAAIAAGYAPDDTLHDARTTYVVDDRTGDTWTPRNFGSYSGAYVTLRQGLTWSKNTVSAQLTSLLGPFQIARTARRMGITSDLDPVPSIALGTSEVTLLELASAYGTLAAHGVHHPPRLVTHIDDRHGSRLVTFAPASRPAIPSHVAYPVVDMLRSVVRAGSGAALRHTFGLRADLAGKTGTTQNYADGWFVAMHPNLVVGAWVGFNDRRLTFRTRHWGQASRNALPVVGDFLRRVLDRRPAYASDLTFAPPPGFRMPTPRFIDLADVPYPAAGRDALAAEPDAALEASFDAVLTVDTTRAASPDPGGLDAEAALLRALDATTATEQQNQP